MIKEYRAWVVLFPFQKEKGKKRVKNTSECIDKKQSLILLLSD